MKTALIILFILVVISAIAYFYGMKIVENIDYDYKITSITPKKISFKEDTIIGVVMDVTIKNKNAFGINIKYLYYEIFYQGKLLGRSEPSGDIKISANSDTRFTQSIDLHVNDTAKSLLANTLQSKPNDYALNIYIKLLGLKLKLKNIKFTY